MTTQELPLRDLHLPAVSGWWPLAPGWWLLAVLVAGGIAYLLRRAYLHWRFNAPRRAAIRRLIAIRKEFELGVDAVTLGKEVSELLRRAMLAYESRDTVAGLTGQDWLAWLDRGLDGKPFTEGGGRMLESLPYMSSQMIDDDADLRALLDAAFTRLRVPVRSIRQPTLPRSVT